MFPCPGPPVPTVGLTRQVSGDEIVPGLRSAMPVASTSNCTARTGERVNCLETFYTLLTQTLFRPFNWRRDVTTRRVRKPGGKVKRISKQQ